MMDSRISFWKNILGIPWRYNYVYYLQPKSQSSRNFLVFFGGDGQDTKSDMEKHRGSKEYVKWNLEDTATMLSEQFPTSHIFIIKPSRMLVTINGVYSSFDNFVPGDHYTTPLFCPMYKALKHLQKILIDCLEHIKILQQGKNIDDYNINTANLSLIGFSKGCAVLNQFLHEFHYYDQHPSDDVNSFIGLIKDMWWLDGGHSGSKDTWITDQAILRSFAKLRINVHIHVTPYQVRDTHRPWIRVEENCFNETLQSMGVPVQRSLHFANEKRTLFWHFNVLTSIGSK